jgi:DNA adenine methylase
MINSPIKIQGKKTKIIPHILAMITGMEKTGLHIVEPFAGSGEIGLNIISEMTPYSRVRYYHFSDNNPDVIKALIAIKTNRNDWIGDYCYDMIHFWGQALQQKGETFYYDLRDYFNKFKSKHNMEFSTQMFLTLNHLSYNGLLRYNNSGEFNTPFGHNCNKLSQDFRHHMLGRLLMINALLNTSEGECGISTFSYEGFEQVFPAFNSQLYDGDVLFICDPPYFGKNSRYLTEWTENTQDNFREMMLCSRHPFIVCSWDSVERPNPELAKWEGCDLKRIKHDWLMAGTKKKSRVMEVLITRWIKT